MNLARLSDAQQRLLRHLVESGRQLTPSGLSHHQKRTMQLLEAHGLVQRMEFRDGQPEPVPEPWKHCVFWWPTDEGRALIKGEKL